MLKDGQYQPLLQSLECHEHTVRRTIQRWETQGLGGLWEAPGRGGKAKWQEADLLYLEQSLDADLRTYNSVQLAHKLKQERQVELSADRLSRILKKRASGGNGHGIATRDSKTQSNDNSNKPT